jgi:hypothetical protein
MRMVRMAPAVRPWLPMTFSIEKDRGVALISGRCCKKAFSFQKAFDRVARLGTLIHPVLNSLRIQGHFCRIQQRFVGPDILQVPAVPGAFTIGDNNSIKRFFRRSMSGQSDFNSHCFISPLKRQHSLRHSAHTAFVYFFKHFKHLSVIF